VNYAPNVYVQQIAQKSNSIGTAGFVLAVIGLFLSWIPFLGWIIWFLGLLFSFIGVFRTPRGLSIAGLIISLIGIVILVGIIILGLGIGLGMPLMY